MKIIVLNNTANYISAVLQGASHTTAPSFYASYATSKMGVYADADFDLDINVGVFTGATPVTIVAAPASGYTKIIKSIIIHNSDDVPITFTLNYQVGGTPYTICMITLQPGNTFSTSGSVYDAGRSQLTTLGNKFVGLAATAPAANRLNVPGIANGETVLSTKTILGAPSPSTQAFGDTAVAGSSLEAAHADHKHAMPAAPAAGVARSGATTDAHLAVWNGSNADSIKDGGVVPSAGVSVADLGSTAETVGGAAANGSAATAARSDHKHAITAPAVAAASDVTAGSNTSLSVVPDALAGSTIFGVKAVQVQVEDTIQSLTTSLVGYFYIPQSLNGMNLIRAKAFVATAGTTNATTIQVRNLTKYGSNDALSSAMSIASGGTASTGGAVSASYDDVSTDDRIRISVTAVSTTAPKGLWVILEYQLP